ncbi:hypothetical protein ACFYUV_03855 [Nonomuraea sp. NPDC003560]|uniref:hypothetical protein n=1 Tax=Nonomuraea sp. NPDC003560 TaxID=3364341 RepID=UPI0036CAF91D
MTATATRTATRITIDGETFEITPMDHGGWVATYGDLVLTATDKVWVAGSVIDWDTDKGEDEVRWTNRKAAIKRIRETCQMN